MGGACGSLPAPLGVFEHHRVLVPSKSPTVSIKIISKNDNKFYLQF